MNIIRTKCGEGMVCKVEANATDEVSDVKRYHPCLLVREGI